VEETLNLQLILTQPKVSNFHLMLKQATLLVAITLTALSSQIDAFLPAHAFLLVPAVPLVAARSNAPNSMCFSKKEDDNTADFEVQTRNPLRLAVLRLGMTEPAWTSPLNYQKKEGVFSCAYCGNELFDSDSKYDSGSGWPSFWRSKEDQAVSYKTEFDGRLECRCGKCMSHLGHVFLDGPRPGDVPQALLEGSPPSDPRNRRTDGRLPRFCLNGASLRLGEKE
jgi:peptide-methionine (R)-S-oxide reductase